MTLALELAGLGPYFAVDQHDAALAPEAPWRPLTALLRSPEALLERAEQVRAALASGAGQDVELRVAVSVAQLGLAARLVAPVLGAAVTGARLLLVDEVRWRPVLGGPVPLSLPEGALEGVPYDGDLSLAVSRTLIDGPVRALAEQAQALSVSPKVVWGNVASGVNGAAAMIARSRPDLAGEVASLAAEVLAEGSLRGSAEGELGKNFRRRSCCLLYRVAPRGPRVVCGDCVLDTSR